MEDFKLLLQEFDTVLKEKNLVNYRLLQSPLMEQDIYFLLSEIGLKDENIKELYKWKNGVNIFNININQCAIVKYGTLMSLENILLYKEDEAYKKIWSKKFIPIVCNYDGEYLLFNTSQGKDFGMIYLYSVALESIDNPISCFDSIVTMIETTTECYKGGAINYLVAEDWLDFNMDEFVKIAEKFNPNSSYWKNW